MFSDADSNLAGQNQQLWSCFMGRFNDIEVSVRRICVTAVTQLVVNHPELVEDLVGKGCCILEGTRGWGPLYGQV